MRLHTPLENVIAFVFLFMASQGQMLKGEVQRRGGDKWMEEGIELCDHLLVFESTHRLVYFGALKTR